jgi:hypothetical protein
VRVVDDVFRETYDKIAIEKVLDLDSPRSFARAPEVTFPAVEPSKKETCEDCDGRGTVHECPDCQCVCDGCGGSGEVAIESKISTDFEGQVFDIKYMRLIYSLPELEYATNARPSGPLYFRFAGGVGALMPRTRKHEQHIDIL